MISASALQRIHTCPPSAFLAGTSHETTYSRDGTILHLFVAQAMAADYDTAIAEVPEHLRRRAESIDLDGIAAIFGGVPEVEVAYAWGPEEDAGVRLGGLLDRDYSRRPKGWIPGTADLVRVVGDAASGTAKVIVVDLKFGHKPVPTPAENRQLQHLCLAACRAHGVDYAEAHICKVDEDGESIWLKAAEFDALDLDGFAADTRDLLARIERAKKAPDKHMTTGDHCGFCDAITSCKGIARAVSAMRALDPEKMTPELAAQAHADLPAVRAAVRRVDQALKQYVKRHPFPVDGKHEARMVEGSSEVLDPVVVFRALKDRHGEDVAVRAMTTSKAALGRVLEKADVKALLADVRERGGVGAQASESLKVVEVER